MSIFKLPDLGEGLPDAEIREWYVKEGDSVSEDQPICAMETAKALVDVPSPFAGTVSKLFGQPGDIIQTGAPLISFEGAEETSDAGTVVGAIEVGETVIEESATGVKPKAATAGARIKASLKVRKLAKDLGVDLSSITPTGPAGSISSADVNAAAGNTITTKATPDGFEQLHGARRAMAFAMTRGHTEVADVTLCEDVDIHHFGEGDNITLRIIRAICYASTVEPGLNAHYDGASTSQKLFKEVNLAVAVDTPAGLYAPVIHDVAKKTDQELREQIKAFKGHAEKQDFPPEQLQGATFTLSNFGVFTGRYANPIIVPPMVAILGVGKVRQAVVAVDNQPAVHRIVPLSLTVDHRAITGGEAARFLAAMIEDLSR